ncbi:MAG: potassium transporter [Lysinibacillus sp.]|nr:potassium transporter [Lysinibacillus sp.]
MMKLSSGKNSGTLLLIALVAALLFALYYYVILPKKEEVEMLQSSISTTQSEIASLQEQIEEINANRSLDHATLINMRKKVPATRSLENLVLNIEETQYVSGTKILTIEFNNYDDLVSETELENPYASSEEEEGTDGTVEEGSTEGEEQEETPVSTISQESLPPELKLVTFEIVVASPDFDHLVAFIKEIEKIERIMHIDIIEFALPGEELELSDIPVGSIEATVQVTTFYYEGEV